LPPADDEVEITLLRRSRAAAVAGEHVGKGWAILQRRRSSAAGEPREVDRKEALVFDDSGSRTTW
jgi:hypothetical protein